MSPPITNCSMNAMKRCFRSNEAFFLEFSWFAIIPEDVLNMTMKERRGLCLSVP